MQTVIRYLCILGLVLSQKFTLDGDASILSFVDDATYTMYNEQDLSIVDSSSVSVLKLTQTDTCSMDIDRRMIIHGDLLASTSKSFLINNYDQWKLILTEDFQGQITGWSEQAISNCGTSPDLFLGGYCKFSSNIASKTFKLPPHNYIQIQLTFHFLDKWESESAFMKIDGNYVWSESYQSCSNMYSDLCQTSGINVCGDDFPDRMGFPVRYIGKHNQTNVKLEVSTNLKRSACEVSWGIDDIQIYIR